MLFLHIPFFRLSIYWFIDLKSDQILKRLCPINKSALFTHVSNNKEIIFDFIFENYWNSFFDFSN